MKDVGCMHGWPKMHAPLRYNRDIAEIAPDLGRGYRGLRGGMGVDWGAREAI